MVSTRWATKAVPQSAKNRHQWLMLRTKVSRWLFSYLFEIVKLLSRHVLIAHKNTLIWLRFCLTWFSDVKLFKRNYDKETARSSNWENSEFLNHSLDISGEINIQKHILCVGRGDLYVKGCNLWLLFIIHLGKNDSSKQEPSAFSS